MVFEKYIEKFRVLLRFSALLLAFSLVGCASGNLYSVAKNDIPTLKPDMGRIFVYRSFNPLSLLRPLVFKLDGKNIADTYSATIFYHDVKPGKHTINFTGGHPDFSFNLTMGGAVYIRYSVVPDEVAKGNAIAELVDPKVAINELKNVRLIEKKIRYPDELG